MKTAQLKPPVLLSRAFVFLLQKRIHFAKETIGTVFVEPDDDYEIFRKVVLKRGQLQKPGAVLRVTFKFARFSSSANKKLSLIPIPFIIGQPGFRSKTWMIGKKTGNFRGLYEWDTVESARNYWSSFPMRLMKRRAVPKSLHFEIHPVVD